MLGGQELPFPLLRRETTSFDVGRVGTEREVQHREHVAGVEVPAAASDDALDRKRVERIQPSIALVASEAIMTNSLMMTVRAGVRDAPMLSLEIVGPSAHRVEVPPYELAHSPRIEARRLSHLVTVLSVEVVP